MESLDYVPLEAKVRSMEIALVDAQRNEWPGQEVAGGARGTERYE